MNIKSQLNSEDRAVSPVIGVILMVAITVILAAVIGTFVLGLGDQLGDSAPQASFSTEATAFDDTAGDEKITLDIEKTGGQDLTAGDLTLSIEGDRKGDVVSLGDLGSESWQTGQTATFVPIDISGENPSEGDRLKVQLIHDPSGQAIYSATITVPAP